MSIWLKLRKLIGWKHTAKCGHKTHREITLSAFGETAKITIPLIDGALPYCADCLSQMTIRCAICGRPIFIGEQIVLGTPKGENKFREDATKHEDAYVICTKGCADPFNSFSQWVPAADGSLKGEPGGTPSIERIATIEVLRTNRPAIIHDNEATIY